MEVEKNITKRKYMDILATHKNKKQKTKQVACLNCNQKTEKTRINDCEACCKSYCNECLFECEHCETQKCFTCFMETTKLTCVFWRNHCANCEKLICFDCKIFCNQCEKYYCIKCVKDNGGCPWNFSDEEHIVLSKNCERKIKDLSMIK
jgi:hypothetical protein